MLRARLLRAINDHITMAYTRCFIHLFGSRVYATATIVGVTLSGGWLPIKVHEVYGGKCISKCEADYYAHAIREEF